jgi:hypothetical protein
MLRDSRSLRSFLWAILRVCAISPEAFSSQGLVPTRATSILSIDSGEAKLRASLCSRSVAVVQAACAVPIPLVFLSLDEIES